MKTFREHIKEEVMPSALVADGSIDIEKDAVRDNINALLDGAVNCPSVTPYNALMKVRKVLSYFAIQLPKRAYMEGKHGIEVWEIHQFGERMGMTDQGEFIKSVPCKYYLFFHYHAFGSMFSVRAKIVDREELDKEMDMAEMMIKEDAADRLARSKVLAPHEEMHDEDEGTEGTKKAVEVSMRRKDKKLSADQLDEVSVGKLRAYRRGAEQELGDIKHFKKHPGQYPAATSDDIKAAGRREKTRESGIKLSHKKITGKAKVGASAPKHPYMEETLDEAHKVTGVKGSEKGDRYEMRTHAPGEHHEWSSIVKTHQGGKSTQNKYGGYSSLRTGKTKYVKKHFDKLEEKLTKGMSPADVISDFVHSDDPKFTGKSKKERMKMALGAYYGMHPEKSRKE